MTAGEISHHLEWADVEKLVDEQLRLQATSVDDNEELNRPFDSIPDLNDDLASIDLDASIRALEQETDVKSPKKHEAQYVAKFRDFLAKYPHLRVDLDTSQPEELSVGLRYFYGTLRKTDGQPYAPSSLVCIRAALFRYLMKNRGINIISDGRFYSANQMLKAGGRLFFARGGRVDHFQAMEPSDLQKLGDYFERSTPTRLLLETYYNVVFYFGTRGREWLRDLRVDSFEFDKAPDGREIVRLREKRVKNVARDLGRAASDNVKEAVMTESPVKCPVECLRLYLLKRSASIPSSSSCGEKASDDVAFFLKPKVSGFEKGTWFSPKQPIGVNGFAELFPRICVAASLSRRYTAHCVRSTVIKELSVAGHSVSDICKVTGHKATASVGTFDSGHAALARCRTCARR
uniref:DUF3504 domain-containing protein n=1 Tax=Macrostomum lignano TaxID=282301 RepID=A0A1I8GNC8_9PLAT